MMNINVNQPLSPQALGALYMGNGQSPDQNDSDLFMAGTDAYNYVQQQAKGMGIDDPKAYFNNLVTQQKLANTPSGFQMEMARQAGQFSPNSLPGQLAARNAMADQVSAANDQQNMQTQLAQRAAALQRTPLPSAMNPAAPLDPNSFGAQTGMNPDQYAMTKRLGGVTAGNQFIGNGQAPLDPSTLTNDPRFQSLLTTHPDQANQVFSAITGGDLGTFMKQKTADAAAADQQQRDTVTSWIKDQSLRFNPTTNNYEMRQLVPDIANPGHSTLSQDWQPLSPIQTEWVKKQAPSLMPMTNMDQRMATAAAAARARASTGSTSSSNAQASASTSTDSMTQSAMRQSPAGYYVGQGIMGVPGAMDYMNQNVMNPVTQTGVDSMITVGNAAKGVVNLMGGNTTPTPHLSMGDVTPFNQPSNMTPNHARTAAVVNTPQFRNLLKTNPNAARMIIQRLQQPTPDNSTPTNF